MASFHRIFIAATGRSSANQSEGAYLEGGKGLATVDTFPRRPPSAGKIRPEKRFTLVKTNLPQPPKDRFLPSL